MIKYIIKGTKATDSSKVDIETVTTRNKLGLYKAIEIDDLKEYIEQAQNKCLIEIAPETKFSKDSKRIIDSYNAGRNRK